LEISPTSNVRTKAIASLDEHPLARIVEAGVPVSINSDDPPMFGTTLADEYAVAARLLELDAGGVARLAKAAVEQSFMPATNKTALLTEIDAYASKTP
jgi:aminodeoxyfutalosine deaminase